MTEPSRAILPPPDGVRTFSGPISAGIADCSPSGRVRLDAAARWLQDIAYADLLDVGLQSVAVWVVRRTRIRVNRWPRFAERCTLTTFCTGLGRTWAERRTDVTRPGASGPSDVSRPGASGPSDVTQPGASGPSEVSRPGASGPPDVEAVSLWVHLDPQRRLPFPLTEAEVRIYSGRLPQRRVTARLRHPAPPPAVERRSTPWTFRATECDIADHVNNAAYWQPLEEELLLRGSEPGPIDIELEYRAPAQPGTMLWVADRACRWIVDVDRADEAGEDEVHASFLLEPPD